MMAFATNTKLPKMVPYSILESHAPQSGMLLLDHYKTKSSHQISTIACLKHRKVTYNSAYMNKKISTEHYKKTIKCHCLSSFNIKTFRLTI